MILTRISLSNPVAVIVACILLAIFGSISLARLPIQLSPEIERPEITISTIWRASAPTEIESEIVEPQEDVLRSIPGLLKLQSTANFGSSYVNLQFAIGTDMNRALIEVMNSLNQVPRYPVDAEEPIISVGSQDFDRAIAWWAILPQEGNSSPVNGYQVGVTNAISKTLTKGNQSLSSAIFFGNAADFAIGYWGGLSLEMVRDTTDAKAGQRTLVANQYYDAGLLRAQSFSAMLDALTA